MRKFTKVLATALTFVMLAGPATVYAEEASTQTPDFDLEQIVITATKTERPLDKVTQKVTVIDKEEIDKIVSGNKNLSELLMYQPGIAVSVLSRNHANWGTYGGLGPNYNTYMIDGMPMSSATSPMALDAFAVEQVESQRGPAPVLYSNYLDNDFGVQSPLAGTTNFRLKDKIDQPLTKINLGIGSYNTRNMSIYSQGSQGAWDYFIGGSFEKSDYASYKPDMLNKPKYDKTKIYFKTAYDISDNKRVSLFTSHTDNTGDEGKVGTGYDHNYDFLNLSYKSKISDRLDSEFKLGYRSTDRKYDDLTSNMKQQNIPVDMTFTYKNGANQLLTFGTDYQSNKFEFAKINAGVSSTQTKVKTTSQGLFAQQEFFQGPWTFHIGSRYNKVETKPEMTNGAFVSGQSKSWDKVLWSAGARYAQNDKLSWYTNIGTTFNTPSAKDVFGTVRADKYGISGNKGQLPATDLKPESGTAYDLGFDYKLSSNSKLGLRTFYSEVKDRIQTEKVYQNPGDSDDNQSRARNVGKTKSKGIELDYQQKIQEGFSWFGNYTYTDAENNDGSKVSFVPQNLFNLGFTWEKPKDYSFAIYNHYTSGVYDGDKKGDGYSVTNAKFQKQLKDGVKANLDLYNLGNKKFEMPWGFQDPGFSYQASLEFEF